MLNVRFKIEMKHPVENFHNKRDGVKKMLLFYFKTCLCCDVMRKKRKGKNLPKRRDSLINN